MARDTGATNNQVRQWRARGKIPPSWWGRVARAAQIAGHESVTTEKLEEAATQAAGGAAENPAPPVAEPAV